MTGNIPPFTQRGGMSDVMQQIQRFNPSNMGGLISARGFPSTSGHSMLGPLNTAFNGGAFSSGASESAPPPLDHSEYPTLGSSVGNSVTRDSLSHGSHVGARPGSYGGLNPGWGGEIKYCVKQPVTESSEFTMSNEDFPALPGTNKQPKLGSQQHQQHGDLFGDKKGGSSSAVNAANNALSGEDAAGRPGGSQTTSSILGTSDKNNQSRRGIQTSLDGKVTNIPKGMVKDQFGMVGLLTFIRAAENETNLVSLALGSDLTSLGLNLNSPETLYPNFGGPWSDSPCGPQDIDYHVPQEYLVNQQLSMYGRSTKLAPVNFERYGEDLLFYLFYSNIGDVLQMMAAAELYNRDWRYHKEEQVWITRAPGMPPLEKAPNFERGTYFYFDVQNWRKVPKEFHLIYDKLDNQPLPLPTLTSLKMLLHQQAPNQGPQIQQQQQQQAQQQQQQQQQHLNHHPASSALA